MDDKVKIIVEGEDKASSVFKKVGGNLDKLKGVALGVGAAITAAFVGIGAIIAGTVPKAIEFDKAMRNVNAIAQLNEEEFQQLSKDVLEFSKTTRASAADVAGALYNVVSAGYDSAEGFEVMTQASRAAGAGLAETDSTSKLLIATLRSYQLPVTEAERVTDLFLHTVNQGITTLPELATGLGRIMPVASSLGVSVNELGFSIARMTQTGLSTDEAVTRLQATFTAMLNPTEELDAAVKSLGYTSGYDLVQQSGGALGALRVLKEEGFLDTTEEAANLFNNVRALGGVMSLTAEDATLAAGAVAKFGEDAEGAVERARVEQYKSFAALWEKFKSTLEVIAIEVGKPVMDFLIRVLDLVAGRGIPILESFVAPWTKLWEWISHVFTLLVEEGWTLKDLFTTFEDGSSVMAGFFEALGFGEETAHELGNAINAVVGFLIALVDWVKEAIMAIGRFLTPIWEWVRANVELQDILIAIGIMILPGLIAGIWALAAAIAGALVAAAPFVLTLAGLIALAALLRTAWDENWGGMRDKITEVWEETIKPALESLEEWLQEKIPLAIATATTWWNEEFLPALQTVWAWIVENIFPMFETMWEWLQENIPEAIETCKTFWEDELWPALQEVWAWIVENIFPMFEETWEWLEEKVPEAIETCKTFWTETLWPALQDVWAWITGTLFPMFEEKRAWLQEKIPIAIQASRDYWMETLYPALQDVWAWIEEYLLPIFIELSEFFKNTLNLALIVLEGLWRNLILKVLTEIWEFIKTPLMDAWKTLEFILVNQIGPAIAGVNILFGLLKDALSTVEWWLRAVRNWLQRVNEALRALPDSLPGWLTGHSPSPFELSLMGISNALEVVNPQLREFYQLTAAAGNMAAPLSAAGGQAGSGPGWNQQTEWHLHVYGREADAIRDFGILQSMAGA